MRVKRVEDIEDCRRVLRQVMREYLAENEEDDDRTLGIKQAIAALPAEEQVLFVLHTEVGSYRQLAKAFGVSRMTIYNRVQEIKQRIKDKLK